MSAAASCPHCGTESLGIDPALGPRPVVDCPGCDRSFIAKLDRLETPAAAPAGGIASLASDPRRHPTDVSLLTSGAVAALATLAIYLVAVPALAGSLLGALLGERGWVPVAITFLAAWSVAILVHKAWLVREQRAGRALLEGVLVGDDPIDDAEAERLATRLEQLRQRYPRSLWLLRTAGSIEHFRSRGRVAATVDHRALASQADLQAVEGSYSLVRVFIWAIPILGFIGTVIGIGAAVAGFSNSVAEAVDLDVMKESIGAVTTGLGVAFDTTLLALVVSLVLMIPTSVLQKAEEDWIAEIDAVCDRQLVRRMRDRLDATADAPSPRTIEDLSRQIARLADALDRIDGRSG